MRMGWRRSAACFLFTALWVAGFVAAQSPDDSVGTTSGPVQSTVATRRKATIAPPSLAGTAAFVNYFAPEDCPVTMPPPTPPSNCIMPAAGSTTAGGHDAGEPSIGVN